MNFFMPDPDGYK